MTSSPLSPPARLRAAMDAGCIAIPGAFNALCARAIARAGFQACYISGAATSVCAGVPDVGVLSFEHFCRLIREVADAAHDDTGPLPVLADADTGFGEAEMVRRTVIEYARAGAAGLHLEDQKFPKRCGHLDGKELVPTDHMVEKIQWAVKAARDITAHDDAPSPKITGAGTAGTPSLRPSSAEGSDPRSNHPSPSSSGAGVPPASNSSRFLICARTDARGVEGFDAAVARARAYVEAGADMIFPEGLTTEDEFARFASSLRASVPSSLRAPLAPSALRRGEDVAASPTGEGSSASSGHPYLLANMTEFGKTPIIPLSRFQEMGYSCVIFPVSLLRVAMGAVTRALDQLKADGSVASFLGQMQTRQDLYSLINYKPGVPWEFPA